jgi:hypothetical protein
MVQTGEPVEAFQVRPVHPRRQCAEDFEIALKELEL